MFAPSLDLGLPFALHSQGAHLHALATLPVYSTVLFTRCLPALSGRGGESSIPLIKLWLSAGTLSLGLGIVTFPVLLPLSQL